jgi:hypothetical protein
VGTSHAYDRSGREVRSDFGFKSALGDRRLLRALQESFAGEVRRRTRRRPPQGLFLACEDACMIRFFIFESSNFSVDAEK